MRTALVLLLLAAPAAAGVLSVEVRDAGGKAVPRARLYLRAAGAPVRVESLDEREAAYTSESGRARLARPEGPLVLVVRAESGAPLAVAVGPEEAQVTVTVPPATELVGVVLGPDGKPVADAEVTVAAGPLLFSAKSGASGRFAVERLPEQALYEVRARAPGLSPALVRAPASSDRPVELRLGAGATVRGRVVSAPGGGPVAGAEVSAGGATALTDESGRFELTGVPPGPAEVTARGKGLLMSRPVLIVLADGESREGLVLRLLELGRMTGRVLAASTEPVAGARIRVRYPPDAGLPGDRVVEAGVTDEKGEFRLDHLVPSAGVDLIVTHPDFAPAVYLGYHVAAGRSFSTLVLLKKGGTVSGRVLDAEKSEPVAGARVLVLDERTDLTGILGGAEPEDPTVSTGLTDEKGAFRIEHVPTGRKAVVALPEGRLPAFVRGVEVANREVREGLDLYVGEGSFLSGTVTDENGPVAGVEVVVQAEVGEPLTTTTDDEGRFLFKGIAPGPYFLLVGGGVHFPVEAPSAGLEIPLLHFGGISGRVLLEDSFQPVIGASVRVVGEMIERKTTSEQPGGAFRFDEMMPGRYRLEAWAEGGLIGHIDGVEPGKDGQNLELRVYRGWAVTGRVVRARDRLPVEGAIVAIRGPTGDAGPHLTRSDAAGRFRIEGVPRGFHELFVTFRGYAPARLGSVEVLPALDTDVGDVELTEGGSVKGTVRGPSGEPRSGARILLTSETLGGRLEAETDEFGAFLFEHVAEGTWLLASEDAGAGPGGRRYEELLEVRDGEEVSVSLGSGEGTTLTGRVLSGGDPVPHAEVTALRIADHLEEKRRMLTTRADEDGIYVLPDLAPGPVLLLVKLSTGTVRFPVEVAPGPVFIRDLFLPESGIEGRVESTDGGMAVPGAEVVLTRDEGGTGGTFLAALNREVARTRSAFDGTFLFPALPPGEYRIEAFAEGYGQVRRERVVVRAGTSTPVRLALPPAGSIAGTVTDMNGRPVTDARVTVREEGAPAGATPQSIEVDSRGRFAASSLRSGAYVVEASAPGHSRHTERGVQVAAGSTVEIQLHLHPEGRIDVRVFGPGGVPLEGAQVAVADFWGRPVFVPRPRAGLLTAYKDPSLTDAAGSALVPHLAPGVYTLTASLPGYRGEPARVTVLDGELARAAVVLLPVDEKR